MLGKVVSSNTRLLLTCIDVSTLRKTSQRFRSHEGGVKSGGTLVSILPIKLLRTIHFVTFDWLPLLVTFDTNANPTE